VSKVIAPSLPLFEKLFFDPTAYRERLIQLIDQAQKEILITCYIVEDDEFGAEVLKKLEQKAGQGVRVKLCADGYGSSDWADKVTEQEPIQNYEIRIYHPPPWWAAQVTQFFTLLYHLNFRNHQKLFLFDGTTAIIGSRNINSEALEWRETSIEVKEAEMLDLRNIFENLWSRSHTQKLKAPKRLKAPRLPVPSPYYFTNHLYKLRRERNQTIRNHLLSAKNHIFITTPYFMPRHKSLKILCDKAKAGVSVEVVLPRRTDVPISKWLAQSLYYEMLKSGIKIYEYNEAVLHAKTLIIDGWTLVGSSNFNRRSAIRDLEIDYVLRTPECLEEIAKKFAEDKSKSIQVFEVPNMRVSVVLAHLISRIFYSWF
jgi:cardiolipin synthase A/B